MSKKDKAVHKAEEASKNRKKRDCTPPDNYGDNYVTGQEKLRTQGKGGRYRVLEGWYTDEMKDKFNKIFDKRQEEYNKNTDNTDPPEFDGDE